MFKYSIFLSKIYFFWWIITFLITLFIGFLESFQSSDSAAWWLIIFYIIFITPFFLLTLLVALLFDIINFSSNKKINNVSTWDDLWIPSPSLHTNVKKFSFWELIENIIQSHRTLSRSPMSYSSYDTWLKNQMSDLSRSDVWFREIVQDISMRDVAGNNEYPVLSPNYRKDLIFSTLAFGKFMDGITWRIWADGQYTWNAARLIILVVIYTSLIIGVWYVFYSARADFMDGVFVMWLLTWPIWAYIISRVINSIIQKSNNKTNI